MKALILGSGVLGITCAWYLAKAGYEETVLDRQPGPGLETSFGNAGMISPGYSAWAAPGVPLKAIKWLLSEHAPPGHPPYCRSAAISLDDADAVQLYRRPLRR